MIVYQKIVNESGLDESIDFFDLDLIAKKKII